MGVYVEPLLLPEGLSPNAVKVAEGFALLLAIRDLRESGPAPFTQDFGAAWCGLEPWQVREGLAELRSERVLLRRGQSGPANLYLPASVAAEQRRVA
jgi:hypothetical protein